ncbi:MAG: hypothetical protein A3F17_03250 [Gammaproteobacteria bacterium RIFCSPHIGHO2_12_FULL_41_15]|nr:MAG: hypothetical protein A3F17_03250 [Gammaproteobacteria bacterium RIFCSPHIGHO2_12_FULL_41_15]
MLVSSILTLGTEIAFAEETPNPESQYYGEQLCQSNPTDFICHRVKPGQSWTKLFPEEKLREKVMRINRRNLPIYAGMWIAVPRDLNKDYMSYAPCPYEIPATGQKLVRINMKSLAFCAYSAKGSLVHWGPVSGGKYWCQDIGRDCSTQEGSYLVFDKRGRECESNTFPVEEAGGAKMPFCMFFYRGYALHASTLPGYNDSHGCVRMFYKDAIWLNRGFVMVGDTAVEVVSGYD